MGADGQPQTHLQVYSALIDFNQDIQEAIEAPRFLSGRFVLVSTRHVARGGKISKRDIERTATARASS
jgi:gamma-glutamyltranspeptidase